MTWSWSFCEDQGAISSNELERATDGWLQLDCHDEWSIFGNGASRCRSWRKCHGKVHTCTVDLQCLFEVRSAQQRENIQAYVEEGGASNALHVNKSWCSEDKEIFHRHLWQVSKHSCQSQFLSATLPDVPERSARYLCDLESPQHELVVPYLAFAKACCFGHIAASLPAYAAIHLVALVSKVESSGKLELEQWVEGGTWLLVLETSLGVRLGSLGFVAGSCCQPSSDSCVVLRAAAESCPCYWRIREYLV